VWLLLCDANDQPALWARAGLEERGLRPFRVVTGEMLGPAVRYALRISDGGAHVAVDLAAARKIRTEQVRGVLNRLTHVPHWRPLAFAHGEDRDYAMQEIGAFFLGWLSALPRPMLNAPTPFGLSGQHRAEAEWAVLAAQAGLRTRRGSSSSRTSEAGEPSAWAGLGEPGTLAIVVGGTVVGQGLPEAVRTACARLAALSGTELLGVYLCAAEGWAFTAATTHPDLRRGGAEVLEALGVALRRGEGCR
jgi:hypothetical protein